MSDSDDHSARADRDGLADAMKALAHPARLAIVETLADRGECVCGDLVEEFPLAQSTISQHLKVLKRAGLIQGTIEGRRTCYCVDRDALKRLQEAIFDYMEGLHLDVDPHSPLLSDRST